MNTREAAMAVNQRPPVLVVDDNPATLYSTSHVLRSVGLEVIEATTGMEAIAKARTGPSLIVLDINLPDIDGFQVCRELRGMPQTTRIPVIYLSATFVDDVDKVQGVNAGADGYLTHPVEPPVLIATVNAFLRARRAEQAVETTEAKFKAVFDNALNGIALFSDELIFIDVNASMCGILGRERDAIVGRHVSAFSPKEQQLVNAEITAALESEGAWRGTLPVLNASGEHVELEWNVSMHSAPDVRLAIVNNVTERTARQAERERLLINERLARAEAEEANRLKDEFLAALSHELRTPLNAIVGYSRVLQMLPVAKNPDVLASIDAIERNARVQAQLISDLLDISRITSGKLQLDRQWFKVADAVQSALASTQNAAKAKKVRMDLQLDPAVESIWWDPSRFHQVVWNLVDNAVKFSAAGGTVHIRITQTAGTVDLEVQDHGRGIAVDFLPHVFERFRQEDSTIKRGHGGLGLGLAVVHQLVSAHGGTISVSSAGEGQGASFVVRLPRVTLAEHPANVEPLENVPHGQLRDVRVLVVEDNDDARALIRRVLTEASAHVLDVPDVESALGALSTFTPDVLVSDVGMPGQDGYDLIRQVRQAGWSPQLLPAIALTAYARENDRLRALNAGYQAHFIKPPDIRLFLAEIRDLVNKRPE
jgi:PAS domain S-box-containing protein